MRGSSRALPVSVYLVAVVWLALSTPAAAEPLAFDDVAEMVRAGLPEAVILSLLEASPPDPLSVDQWLQLGELGAPERVLIALLSPRLTGPEAEPEIRSFFREVPGGSRVFVLTNLDDSGRRIGGESRSRIRPNLVAGRSPEEWDQEVRRTAPEPAPDPVAVVLSSPTPLLEEYLPPGPVAYVGRGYGRRGYGRGFFWSYPFSHFYPPGSYTHLKVFHQGGAPGFGL